MKTRLVKYSLAKISRDRDDFDLNPYFQRGKVWTLLKKQLFLDTVLKGWGVPKVYLAISKLSDTRTIRLCVDGKQRLLTILEFLDNKFNLNKKHSRDMGAKTYQNLPEPIRDGLCDYKLDVEEVTNFSEKDLGILFKRLQLGVSLNSGEKLNSEAGGMADFVRSVTKHPFFKMKIAVPDNRYAFLAMAGQICLLEIMGIKGAKFPDLEKFINANKSFNSRSNVAKEIKAVLDYLVQVFGNKSVELANRGNVISAYLLISFLIKRGNIKRKQRRLKRFFEFFNRKMRRSIVNSSLSDSQAYFLYQTAILQASDSQKSILARHQILLNKLANLDSYFRKLINTTIDEDEFMELYNHLLKNKGGKFAAVEKFLQSLKPTVELIYCDRGTETIPTHVRNSLCHPEHKKHTKAQVIYSLELLREID